MSEPLAKRQAAFMRAVLDGDAPLPKGWGNSQAAGLSVYRGNYRSALISALEATYERTRAYVGEGPFKQAAINHAIAHPPAGWTIDGAGAGFDRTCADFFANSPEVADISWLEWTMMTIAKAADATPMTPQAFAQASAGFGDEEWMQLRLEFQPGMAVRTVSTNLTALWKALGEEPAIAVPDPLLANPRGCIVSREGERPSFQLVPLDNASALAAMQDRASYGEAIMLLAGDDPSDECIQGGAMRAGALIGEWLKDGLITALNA